MNRTERVVLIDDNEMDNEYHTWVLKMAGFVGELVIYNDGLTALNGLSQTDLSITTLIFLDINMPGMDGFAVAEKMKPILHGKPNVTIVMLTSSDATEDRAKARAISSIKGYLCKPLTEDAFKRLVEVIDWNQVPVSVGSKEFWL